MVRKSAYLIAVVSCMVSWCACDKDECCYNVSAYLLNNEHYVYRETHNNTQGSGDLLLVSMFSYIGALYHAFKIVEFKNKRSKHVTYILFSDIGPMPIKSRMNRTIMRHAYNWTDADFNYFLALVGHVRILWKKLSDTAMAYDVFK